MPHSRTIAVQCWLQTLGLALAAFATYSCMYAFRKPFTVGLFESTYFLGLPYKTWLITAQVLGYTSSKFAGIKIISEVKEKNRPWLILGLIGVAWIALLGFALVPKPYNIFFLFLNGFPLGLIWGLVFSYVEGRRTTEILMAALCTSFIFSSGMVKSVGKWYMEAMGIDEYWMPFVTGMSFFPILIASVYVLTLMPKPDRLDILSRTERPPIGPAERKKILRSYFPGLFLLIFTYVLLTSFRDLRDNFMVEMWTELGQGTDSGIFTKTEIPISVIVLIIMSAIVLLKSNAQAFYLINILIILGLVIVFTGTLAYWHEYFTAFHWMVFNGLGLYLAYIPFNGILYDRMVAAFKHAGTAGFLVYISDSFGYLGSTGVLLYKNFSYGNMSWLQFFEIGSLLMSATGIILMIAALYYFKAKYRAIQKRRASGQNRL